MMTSALFLFVEVFPIALRALFCSVEKGPALPVLSLFLLLNFASKRPRSTFLGFLGPPRLVRSLLGPVTVNFKPQLGQESFLVAGMRFVTRAKRGKSVKMFCPRPSPATALYGQNYIPSNFGEQKKIMVHLPQLMLCCREHIYSPLNPQKL